MSPDSDQGRGGWWPGGEGPRRGPRPDDSEPGKEEESGPVRPRGLATPGTPKPAGRYPLFVGLAFVAILVIALLNLLGDDNAGILGAGTSDEGLPLAEFAVVDVAGTSDADANVYQDDCEGSQNPCPEDQQRVPACAIEPEGAIRVCDLFDKPLAISFWFTRGGDCTPTQDAFDSVASRYGDRANFLSVNVRDDRETVTDIVRERGWQVPVGLDPDGAVSNLYLVGGCPTIVLAYPGGILYRAVLGSYDAGEIGGFVDELLTASRERAASDR